ncbi:MAG: hypothetical protein KJ804_12195 [Proteobacteria bacterium]|nr:hypothetical protein [Pseudomonadota bacterium]
MVDIVNTVIATDWSNEITAVATLLLAILTFIYVRLTRSILATHSDPCVVLTVVHDPEHATILQLVARNVGAGLAYDIRFEFSHSLPEKAFGLTVADAKNAKKMTTGPLINGIPALGPGESRKIDWGQYGGLMAAIGDSDIIATCRFKKNNKEMPPTKCPLDVKSFVGTISTEAPMAKTARELAKISKSIQDIATGSHKFKVEVVSTPTENESGKNNGKT